MARLKKAPESVSGRFSALPHAVMDSVAFQGAGHPARSLLYELVRQLSGRNNGHLQLAQSWLKKRGWTSADVVQRAKNQLIDRGLVVQTRQGGLNFGACLYAVTWLSISNTVGLEISSDTAHLGQWMQMDKQPPIVKRHLSSASRSSAVPSDGVVQSSSVPSDGAKTGESGTLAVPAYGNNVFTNTLPAEAVIGQRQPRQHPIVGVSGRSGKRRRELSGGI